MAETSRYRIENEEPVVDIRVAGVEQVFDNRDPAPFRERDLDPALAEYLVDAAEDLAASRTFRIVFWLVQPCPPGEIEQAFKAHFEYEIVRLERERRRHRRAGWVALAIASAAIIGLVALAQLVARVVGGALGAGLKEGLTISGWVLMWRPVEVLVFDSIPWRRQRRLRRRLLATPIDVRTGSGPAAGG
jgi:hypothetical protein